MQEKAPHQFQEAEGIESGISAGVETTEGGGEMPEEPLSRDRKILHEVIREAVSASGHTIDVASVVDMLRLLEQRFGNSFKLEGAYIALERLRQTADLMEREIRKASETEKVEP